jgi:DNA-binding Xre family transcriptional regulator
MSKYIDHSQYPHFGASIRTVLNAKGVTQAGIARKLGISKQHFGKILEARDIKVHLLLSICEAMGCSLNDVMKRGVLDANLNDRNQ